MADDKIAVSLLAGECRLCHSTVARIVRKGEV